MSTSPARRSTDKTLAELATQPWARGVFLRKITRGATATEIPILPDTKINRGDILTLVGRTQDIAHGDQGARLSPTGQTDVADVAFIGARHHHRRADRRAASTRSAACRSRCPPPAAR